MWPIWSCQILRVSRCVFVTMGPITVLAIGVKSFLSCHNKSITPSTNINQTITHWHHHQLLANSSLGWSQVDNTPGPCNGSSTTTNPSSTVRSKKLGSRPLSSTMSNNKPLSPSKKSRRRRQAALTTPTTTATSTTTTTTSTFLPLVLLHHHHHTQLLYRLLAFGAHLVTQQSKCFWIFTVLG